jgi:micrococcal nuclease
MSRPTLRSLLALCALLAAFQAAAAGFAGEVVGVLDGDTIDVLHERRPIRVRLAAIDAPEKSQAFGQKSRQALAALVFRRQVQVIDQGTERHGRTLGVVMVDGINVNAEQVRQGLAWVYRAYSKDAALIALEQAARDGRRGLWSDPHAVPPWTFRRTKEQ